MVRAARNRGIARALKLECFAQAIELGVKTVRTGNDETNAPMLHINDSLGYRKGPGWIHFRKDDAVPDVGSPRQSAGVA